ncbi:FKBP-type peptidyl-prolyl cis-trans isomerase [Isoptericola sp. b441]|uniref:peptidylprolyl isomerase n=1 Tax=Actinotalea lenta TaxID=3064654 RepID=A0ABT9D5D0_9CELL|nr:MULTISPECIES: FKBP-type peptidyl-prolyl cis-trans isomerase [unclassified Isoptericola]MDO8105990.1 FKBP-type peptidyl-prolyl cis-trans isomerase [Isoptericola sp. b441]MDO8122291.1 FKBP-type peptidyl-prolyl cis-trans isomerase [Isoptericola sp. b490]
MRRPATLLLAATLLLPAATVAACSGGSSTPSPSNSSATGSPSSSPTTSAQDEAALAAVKVSGDLGSAPKVTFDTPFAVSTTVARMDTKGSGDPIAKGAMVQVDYAVFSGDDGSKVGSTWDTGKPDVLPLGSLNPAFEPLVSTLVGAPMGSRVVLGIPGAPATESQAAQPSSVMVLEVDKVVPTRATGTPVTPPAGLPTVTLDSSGQPSITVPSDATKPTDLVTQTLIKGDGAEVKSGDTLTVQYSGWLWDGTQFDSSWTRGTPFQTQIGVGQVVKGWDQGLVGQTVGSQVLLVIPPSLGYGDQEQGSIPAGSTLIFVVDILAAH